MHRGAHAAWAWRDDLGATVLWEMDGPNIVQGLLVNTIPTNWAIV